MMSNVDTDLILWCSVDIMTDKEMIDQISDVVVFYNKREEKLLSVLEFYANQLLDYNEVVSQELLADKGQKARDILKVLAEKSKS